MDDKQKLIRIPGYFGTEDRKLFGWFHAQNGRTESNTCVVLCQPLSLDYMSAYRSMRYLADELANQGIPVLRFDYFGTGDSGGYTEDDQTVDYCLWSIDQAVKHAKETTHCENIVLVGFRFGATMAAIYSSQNQVEGLVCWAPIESGKRYLREIKALKLSAEDTSQPNDDGLLEAAGMVYWEKTQDKIRAIKLDSLAPQANQIMIIPRDDLPVNEKLKTAWLQNSNAQIEQLELPGSEGMLFLAEDTVVPHESFRKLTEWLLCKSSQSSSEQSIEPVQEAILKVFDYDEHKDSEREQLVKESLHFYDDNGQYFGVLSEPKNQPSGKKNKCVILVNSGAIHRVGSNRVHVLMARYYSTLDYSTFRLDIPGLGDSYTDDLSIENKEHIKGSEEFVTMALNYLSKSCGFSNFIIGGLSSGAFYAYNAALRIDGFNIDDVLLLNPEQFYVGNEHDSNNDLARQQSGWMYYRSQLANPKKWLKLISGKVNFRYIFSILASKVKNIFLRLLGNLKSDSLDEEKISEELSSDLYFIANKGRKLTFVLSQNDPANSILSTLASKSIKDLMSKDKIHKLMIPEADHTFSRYQPMLKMIRMVAQHLVKSNSAGTKDA